MTGKSPEPSASPSQLVLSRWDDEGGAGPDGHQTEPALADGQASAPKMSEAELVALHIRVIALENMVISSLAQSSGRQLEQVREMAAYISPRPGFTQHPLTMHAAAHMIDLVERASRFNGDETG